MKRTLCLSYFFSLFAGALACFLMACAPSERKPAAISVNSNLKLSAGVVYGKDSREEISRSCHPVIQKTSQSVAALVPRERLLQDKDSDFFVQAKSMARTIGVCPEVRFSEQPSLSICTAFLIDRQHVATAAHCVRIPKFCEKFKAVFGWTQNATQIKRNDLFHCNSVLQDQDYDIAIIKLDREVTGRDPLKFSESALTLNDSLAIVSHPGGVPQKFSIASMRALAHRNQTAVAVIESDTFSGDSGAPVISLLTGDVMAMILSGDTDYVQDEKRSCQIVNVCKTGKCRGEFALNFTSADLRAQVPWVFDNRQK
jgi:hypothetical protein